MLCTKNRNIYGTVEIGGLTDPEQYQKLFAANYAGTVGWDDPSLSRIIRLRLLGDLDYPGWDVSYCHGVLQGEELKTVDVELHFVQLPQNWKTAIVEHAKRSGVYAKGLGVFQAVSTLR